MAYLNRTGRLPTARRKVKVPEAAMRRHYLPPQVMIHLCADCGGMFEDRYPRLHAVCGPCARRRWLKARGLEA